jgi:uncharacterized membrane protein (DUF373 family)
VLGVVDFFRDVTSGSPVETAVINLLNRVLLVLILVEIMHTVVLSLRAHHLVTQPLLIAMIAVFVAALILVSRYDRTDAGRWTHEATGCSAAWLARVLWVLPGVLSNPPGTAPLTWTFDARGCEILTAH